MHLIDPFETIKKYSYLYVIKPKPDEVNEWDDALEGVRSQIESVQDSIAESRESQAKEILKVQEDVHEVRTNQFKMMRNQFEMQKMLEEFIKKGK
jgi:hypothetical protein